MSGEREMRAALDDLFVRTAAFEFEADQKGFKDTCMYLRTALIGLRDAKRALPIDMFKSDFQAVNPETGA